MLGTSTATRPAPKVAPPKIGHLQVTRAPEGLGRRQAGVPLLRRARLERALDRVVGRRVALVVGETGVGKTTLLALWSQGVNGVIVDVTGRDAELLHLARRIVEALRHRVGDLPLDPAVVASLAQHPEALAEHVTSRFGAALTRDTVLALDDVHLLEDGPSARFLTALVRHPPPLLHLVMAGRTAPPLTIDDGSTGRAPIELTGADLVFTVEEVAELLDRAFGPPSAQLVHAVHRATAGWPMAVGLSLEALRSSDDRGHRWATDLAPVGAVARLTRSVYEQAPVATQRILAVSALFEEVSSDLLVALGVAPPGALEALAARGVYLEPGSLGPGWYRLQANVADVVAANPLLSEAETAALHVDAARWFSAADLPQLAVRALVAAGRHQDAAMLLARSGQQLLARGQIELVLDVVSSLPEEVRDRQVERLAGDAWRSRGRWEEALGCYQRAAAEDGSIDEVLAWRILLVHYLRGDPDAALAVYERAETGDDPSADLALLQAWAATVHWSRGEAEGCAELAVLTLRTATEVGDDAALAAAHTALAMLAACEGDPRRNDAHYLEALRHAERAGDVLQLVRIRTNRGSHHLQEGAYALALESLDQAIRAADLAGFAAFGALALSNRGQALLGLGRLEEAQAELESAVAAFRAAGSGMAAYPLNGLGRIAALRRDAAAAREAFEEALGLAEAASDVQGQVPALCGLARSLADEDVDRAAELADRALAIGTGLGAVGARLAAGWVALRRGDRSAGCRYARQAAREAERRRDRAGLADALVLEAAATVEAPRATALAERAAQVSDELGDPIGAARAALVRARHLEHDASSVLVTVRERMRAIGCRSLELDAVRELERCSAPPRQRVRIETFGGLRVVRDGQQIPTAAWKSRQARDLVKLLVSRRGRAVTRDFLVELLWPGQTADEIGNRLNVLLSTIRSILDPDRQRGADGVLCGDGEAVWLDLGRIEVDVESFLFEAATGLQLLRDQRESDAIGHLLRAEAAYTGEYLDDTPYEDWAAGLREEARATYRQVASALVHHALGSGDTDAAVRYLLRILERDPYDESAHLELVGTLAAGGRHTDARRRHRTYAARMEELGVDAVPFHAR